MLVKVSYIVAYKFNSNLLYVKTKYKLENKLYWKNEAGFKNV